KASAQASFQLPELAGQATYSWNADGTVMTVKPSQPLKYATGEHSKLASVAAKTYAGTLNTSALDLAGNALAKEVAFSFSTLGQISWHLTTTSTSEYEIESNGDFAVLEPDYGNHVGDSQSNAGRRIILDFDISGLPQATTAVTAATFSDYMDINGN